MVLVGYRVTKPKMNSSALKKMYEGETKVNMVENFYAYYALN